MLLMLIYLIISFQKRGSLVQNVPEAQGGQAYFVELAGKHTDDCISSNTKRLAKKVRHGQGCINLLYH